MEGTDLCDHLSQEIWMTFVQDACKGDFLLAASAQRAQCQVNFHSYFILGLGEARSQSKDE